jgi:hypothetical protein
MEGYLTYAGLNQDMNSVLSESIVYAFDSVSSHNTVINSKYER